MYLFVIAVHVVLCLLLVLIILLQPGKGGDVGSAFGGGVGGSKMFGPRGPTSLLARATTTVAVLFMVTSITLALDPWSEEDTRGVDQAIEEMLRDEGTSEGDAVEPAPEPEAPLELRVDEEPEAIEEADEP